MQGAVFRRMYQNTWSPLFHCNSNCTWEQGYISLVFDSSCVNVTAEKSATKLCIDAGAYLMICEFTTPGGVSLTTKGVLTSWKDVAIVNASSLLGDRSDSASQSLSSDLVHTAIWTNISNTARGQDYNYAGKRDSIIECTLSLVA
jgi:hypothetical protein